MDVNDVSYALQRVIDERKAENTWQVDCFGGVEGPIQPPDEVLDYHSQVFLHRTDLDLRF